MAEQIHQITDIGQHIDATEMPTDTMPGQPEAADSHVSRIPGLHVDLPQPERPHVPAETIREAFKIADDKLYELSANEHFLQYCIEQKIDPEDKENPHYWYALADYTQARVKGLRDRLGGDNVRVAALELLGSATAAAYAQNALDHYEAVSDEEYATRSGSSSFHNELKARAVQTRENKERVSTFNGLVRNFAANYPEVRYGDMSQALLGTLTAIEDDDLLNAAAYRIEGVLRGARHELAFGQILSHTGRAYREATVEEDLRGVDYVIDMDTPRPLLVDVKASLGRLKAGGRFDVARNKSDQQIVVYSLVRDEELGDSFYISDEKASHKAQFLNEILDKARASVA